MSANLGLSNCVRFCYCFLEEAFPKDWVFSLTCCVCVFTYLYDYMFVWSYIYLWICVVFHLSTCVIMHLYDCVILYLCTCVIWIRVFVCVQSVFVCMQSVFCVYAECVLGAPVWLWQTGATCRPRLQRSPQPLPSSLQSWWSHLWCWCWWCWYIYYDEVFVCLSVTKNEHFLLGVSCNHLNPP